MSGTPPPLNVRSAIRELVRHAIRYTPRQLVLVLLLVLLSSVTEGISLLLLVPILKLIDPTRPSALLDLPTGPAAPWLGATIAVSLGLLLATFVLAVTLRAILMRYKDLSTRALLDDLANHLRDELFGAVARARWMFLARIRGSDINHAVTADIDRIQASAHQLLQLVQTGVVLAVYGVIALVLSPTMTLIAIGIGVAVIVPLSPIRKLALKYGATLTRHRQDQYRIVTEFLGGLKIAKASNTEPLYVAQFSRTLQAMRNSTMHFMRLYSIGTMVFQIGTAAGLALFIWLAVGHLALAYSSLIALVLLFVRIGPRVAAIHGNVQGLLTSLPALFAMLQMRDSAQAQAETSTRQAASSPALTQEIEVDHVSFGYEGSAGTLVVQDVSFRLPANKVTAIIGPSGSGKSTLGDLLMGLLEPVSGTIRVDGVPLAEDNRRAWRDRLAYVPQDNFLLNDTIATNLRLGRRSLTDDHLRDALEVADAAALVRRLPNGLETVVGDRGIRLSGGERQRIALARALLRSPALLVLDEATSALDWESQAAIASAIRSLRGDMTIVTIAHRPSMISFADWVIAVDEGRIVENGPYEALVQRKDSYLSRVLAGDR